MWRRWHRWCTYKPRNTETANNIPWTAARQASLSITNSRSLLKLVHRVGDAIQPSHPLSSPSPPTFNLSQHQGLFQWVSSSHQLAKVLELQHQSFQWVNIQDWFPLGLTDWISLQSKGHSRFFSNTTVQKHQFFSSQLSLWSNPCMTIGKTISLTRRTFVSKVMSLLFTMLFRLVIAFLSKGQELFNFMAAITICSDFGAQKNSLPLFPLFPHLFAMKWWDWMSWL